MNLLALQSSVFFFTTTFQLFFHQVKSVNPPIYSDQMLPSYDSITTSVNGSVLRATLNNPPINLYDHQLSADLLSLVRYLENRTDIKVVILCSANPDYFIAHYDIHLIDIKSPPPPPTNTTEVGLALLATRTKLATLPIIFIAEISGQASGAGNELIVQSDMRFAGPNTKLSQLEVGFGLLPGAGGLQFLVNLIGRARAFEYILSGNSVDARTAEAIGWVNKAYASRHELHDGVQSLAQRIATFPKAALAAIKQRINFDKPSDESLNGDNDIFYALSATTEAQRRADRYLELSDNQVGNQFELNLTEDLEELGK
ncbi:MAG: hypothetical protein LQ342_001748 [Letrouitia transgressa]|nr:MAG: hypothetical protein LQ342_001748 [Letrouitia transgressa]